MMAVQAIFFIKLLIFFAWVAPESNETKRRKIPMSYKFDDSQNTGITQGKGLQIGTQSFTILVWVKRPPGGAPVGIYFSGDNTEEDSGLFLQSNFPNFSQISVFFDGPSANHFLTRTVNPAVFTRWELLTIRYDVSLEQVTIDYDGRQSYGAVTPPGFSTNETSLGFWADSSPSAYSNCWLSHFSIWDRYLDDTEVDDLKAGKNPYDIPSGLISYLPLIDGLRDWTGFFDNPTLTPTPPTLNADNPPVDPPEGYKTIIVGRAAAGIDEWGVRNDPYDLYGDIDDDTFDEFGDRVSGLYENREDQPGQIPAFYLEVEPNGIDENQIVSVEIGASGEILEVGNYGDNGGYGELSRILPTEKEEEAL